MVESGQIRAVEAESQGVRASCLEEMETMTTASVVWCGPVLHRNLKLHNVLERRKRIKCAAVIAVWNRPPLLRQRCAWLFVCNLWTLAGPPAKSASSHVISRVSALPPCDGTRMAHRDNVGSQRIRDPPLIAPRYTKHTHCSREAHEWIPLSSETTAKRSVSKNCTDHVHKTIAMCGIVFLIHTGRNWECLWHGPMMNKRKMAFDTQHTS